MNKMMMDIIRYLHKNQFVNQRDLANVFKCSLGMINKTIRELLNNELIDNQNKLTIKALNLIKSNSPKSAIILAAGYGNRMVPINKDLSKAFLEVNGETLIERQIKQLKKVGINDINIVIGYKKESFDFLIDKYNVNLIVNRYYDEKNNMYSLYLALNHLKNTYIVPCDIWCKDNPFSDVEIYSWYGVKNTTSFNTDVKINTKNELIKINRGIEGNNMIGIAYINQQDSQKLATRINSMIKDPKNENAFWEDALYENKKMFILGKVYKKSIVEINTYEQLRDLDSNSKQLKSLAIDTVKEALNVDVEDINNIKVLKKGMTNRSFLFEVMDNKYIMRIPGEGTDKLINRKEEAQVYHTIKDKNICDDIIYINPNNGYKITKFLNNYRVCDAYNDVDLNICMNTLKKFHNLKLNVNHEFNIFDKIDFYESLWNGKESLYADYKTTKQCVLELKDYIDMNKKEYHLTHIDAVPDNFLINNLNNDVRLIDWEYAAMQDSDVDIAMFCIYALYDKKDIDKLIDIYYQNQCDEKTRIKIYCYVAACGLLWSNWCEYKHQFGVEFGEYSLKQYRYAKDFYKYAKKGMEKLSNE